MPCSLPSEAAVPLTHRQMFDALLEQAETLRSAQVEAGLPACQDVLDAYLLLLEHCAGEAHGEAESLDDDALDIPHDSLQRMFRLDGPVAS